MEEPTKPPYETCNLSPLIPIQFSLNILDREFNDFLIWDTTDNTLTPEQFAYLTTIECDLPAIFATEISRIIQKKLDLHARLQLYGAPRVCVTVPISLDFNGITLRDRVLWDSAHCAGHEVEDFAQLTIAELSLSDAFVAPYAFSIRQKIFHEQVRLVTEFQRDKDEVVVPNEFSGQVSQRTGNALTINGPIITPAAAANNISDSMIINVTALTESNPELKLKASKISTPDVIS